MYSQLDKLAKTAVQQQQGAQLARELQQDAARREALRKSEIVNELRTDNGAVLAVHERGEDQTDSRKKNRRQDQPPAEDEEKNYVVITEPHLGRHIDVSG
jgi:hypothetical protein